MSTTSVEGLTSLTGEFDVLVQPSVYDSDSDGNSSVVSDSVFSLRYGFRPDSLDPSTVLKLQRENDSITIETQGSHTSESHLFKGSATDGGEAECVLLYNPESNKFELRPLNYAIRVAPASRDRKTSPSEEEEEEEPAPEAAVTLNPEDTMQHWNDKFNNKPRYKPAEKTGYESKASYKSKEKSVAPRLSTPIQSIEVPVNDYAEADIEMGQDMSDNDDDDDELLGELVNELEGSLEGEGGKAEPSSGLVSTTRDLSDSDSDSGMRGGMIEIVENRPKPGTSSNSFYQSPPKTVLSGQQGPISLRGFISGQSRENEEDLLSSSEEE